MNKVVQRATEIVSAIRQGYWSHEAPSWAPAQWGAHFLIMPLQQGPAAPHPNMLRAIHTAEAFCILFADCVPGFNQLAFLTACGFAESHKAHRARNMVKASLRQGAAPSSPTSPSVPTPSPDGAL